MKKLIFLAAAMITAGAAMAAAHTAAPATDAPKAERSKATVLPDEKAENADDKKAIKKMTPKVKEAAKEEANKTSSGATAK